MVNYLKISLLYNNRVSNLVNDKFDIQAINSSQIKLLIFLVIGVDYKSFELFDNNTIQIIYNETNLKSNINKDNIASNLKKINNNSDNLDMNTNNISSNLEKINDNSSDISTNLGKIDINKNDISTNLIKINSNEDDMLYNSNEISYLKNNNSAQYLKNICNILFYDKKTQISFRNLFYEKIFDVNASINSFIEMKKSIYNMKIFLKGVM